MSSNNTISNVPNNINYKVMKDQTFVTTSAFFEADGEPLLLDDYLVTFSVYTITRSRETVLTLTSNSELEIVENKSTINQSISLLEGKYLYNYTISGLGFSGVLQKGTFEVVEDSLSDSENEDIVSPCGVEEIGPSNITVTLGYIIESEGDKHYTHEQTNASATWIVNHNLDKHPSIEIVDSAGTKIQTNRIHHNKNSLTLYFTSPTTGKVFCN